MIKLKLKIGLLLLFCVFLNVQAEHPDSFKCCQKEGVVNECVASCKTSTINEKIEKIENFKKNDAHGWGMTVTAMGVVFLGLIALYLMFKLVNTVAVFMSDRRTMKATGVSKAEARSITERSGAVYAAIAMAIYEATELHDEERTILTIKDTERRYSPWSSKIYTLRELPNKK